MKMQKSMLCVLLSFICAASMAQKTDTRQKLFSAYPADVTLDRSVISTSFEYTKGATVTVPFSSSFKFTGTVISNESKYDNLQTVLIRSSDNNTVFQLNKIINPDKSISYTGRTFNDNSADGYEVKNNNGNYSLQKFETARALEPCHNTL